MAFIIVGVLLTVFIFPKVILMFWKQVFFFHSTGISIFQIISKNSPCHEQIII